MQSVGTKKAIRGKIKAKIIVPHTLNKLSFNWGCLSEEVRQKMTEKRDDSMAVNKKESNAVTTAKTEDILKLSKKGMNKYRKTLDKLAKN